jgi:hypothetical protein
MITGARLELKSLGRKTSAHKVMSSDGMARSCSIIILSILFVC